MGTADGGFRSVMTRGSRGEPMAAASIAVRVHRAEGVLSDIATHPRIKTLISSRFSPPVPRPLVRDRPGPKPTARPRAGARDGGARAAAARPRPGARGKEGGPA